MFGWLGEIVNLMKFLIIGTFPPPLGGISVHTVLLLEFLNAQGFAAKGLDIRASSRTGKPANVITLSGGLPSKLIALLKLSATLSADTILHFQTSSMNNFKWVAPVLLFCFRHQPKIITIHSGSFPARMAGNFNRIYLRFLLDHFNRIIVVSAEIYDFLTDLGILNSKLVIIPAFIPQLPDPKLIPPEILQLASEKSIVVTSGFLTPLYNYDILIDCIKQLDDQRYTFVFCFYGTIDPEYEKHVLGCLAEFDNILIFRDKSPKVFVSIMSVSTVYVRTTLSDGDSNAIREALYSGKTVLATNCVKRPAECLLFSSTDSRTLLSLFNSNAKNPKAIPPASSDVPMSRMLNVYQEIYNQVNSTH